MKKHLLSIAFIFCCTGFISAQQKVPVFVSGTGGYKSYRIPAIVSLPNGEQLAFCKGRVHGAGDFTAYSDLVKISKNKIGILYERDNYSQIVFTVVKFQ